MERVWKSSFNRFSNAISSTPMVTGAAGGTYAAAYAVEIYLFIRFNRAKIPKPPSTFVYCILPTV